MADISSIVTAILGNGLTEYTGRIPAGTRANILEVGNAIMNYSPMANAFINNLFNKIVLQAVQDKIYSNPLANLKKGDMPFGFDIENSWINPASAGAYDRTGANLLATSTPTTFTEYFRVNRQDVYKHSVWRDELKSAFTDSASFEKFVNGITNALYNGDYQDEFILMKRLLADAVLEQRIRCANITAVTDAATATALLTAVKNVSSAFQYPSTAWNGYNKFNAVSTLRTFCPKPDQILIMRSDLLNYVDVNVLAGVFNLGKAEMLDNLVEVDNFGECSNVLAMILDKNAIQVYDKLFSGDEPFYNPEGRYWNLYLHHWQLLAMSLLVNGCAITDDGTADAAPVLTEGSLENGSTTVDGTAVTGSRVYVEIYEDDGTTLIKRYSQIAAANAFDITVAALVTGEVVKAYQVDMGGNKSALDTFTVVSGS